MTDNFDYWKDICDTVKKLQDSGMSVLEIEDETGIMYEDILWAIELTKETKK